MSDTTNPAPVAPAFVGETKTLTAPPGPVAALRAHLFDRAPLIARTMQEAGFTEPFYIGYPSLDKARFVYLPEMGEPNAADVPDGFTMQTAPDEAEAQRLLMEWKAGRTNA